MSEITKSKAHSIWTQELYHHICHLVWCFKAIFWKQKILFSKKQKKETQTSFTTPKVSFFPKNNPKNSRKLPPPKFPKKIQVGITWRFVPPLLLDLWSIAYVSWNGPTKVVPLLQGHWPCWCWWENWPTCWLTDTWWRCLKQLGMEFKPAFFFWKKVLETWKT